MDKKKLGVIVGRFQIDDLHEGHQYLIEKVKELSDNLIIVIGVSITDLTFENPLGYVARKLMIEEKYDDVKIVSLKDVPNDDVQWSYNLDEIILNNISSIDTEVTLYGSRDSFVNYYHGQFETKQIETPFDVSATEKRKEIKSKIGKTSDWRKGVIFATQNMYPKVYPTVDIACTNNGKVLLAKKPKEVKFRFPGGFVDPTDINYAHAGIRELKEETNISVDVADMKYIDSIQVPDLRYLNGRDKIITTLFTVETTLTDAKPMDDIAYVEWVDIDSLSYEMFVDTHKPLAKLFFKYIITNNL
jgi:bifunctional NMN adenylyltransferase/nudix hydrolase